MPKWPFRVVSCLLKRLQVYGFDVRDAAAEQVEAMGAKFLRVDFQEDGSAQSRAPDSYYTTWGGLCSVLAARGSRCSVLAETAKHTLQTIFVKRNACESRPRPLFNALPPLHQPRRRAGARRGVPLTRTVPARAAWPLALHCSAAWPLGPAAPCLFSE